MPKSPDRYSPEEIVDMQEQRKVSDKELVEGGAEVVYGELKITSEQYEHLQKAMEAGLVVGEREGGTVGYIKKHIESDLSFQPELQQRVARTLKALLKLSSELESDAYMSEVLTLTHKLGERIKLDMPDMSVYLNETMKAATLFQKLDDSQKKDIEDFLEAKIEKPVGKTLEQCVCEKLGLEATYPYSFDTALQSPEAQMLATLATFNSGNLEDFSIDMRGKERVSNEELEAIIVSYYGELGFEVTGDLFFGLFAKKEDKELTIITSNFSDRLLVSVLNG